MKKQLGVNIDHVATVRQARGGTQPSIATAVREVIAGGADGITIHLREDRRHIQDMDVVTVQKLSRVPVNLEMSLDPGIVKVALKRKPEKCCIVPEKRQELTTEGGLNVIKKKGTLRHVIPRLQSKKIEVSLFIDPSLKQVRKSAELGADAIEIHTGTYCNAKGAKRTRELSRIRKAAKLGAKLGLKVNAGHGLDYQNVKPVARIPEIQEFNIGHALVSHAIFVGLKTATRDMKKAIAKLR